MQITISRRMLIGAFTAAVTVAALAGYVRGVEAQTASHPIPIQPILSGDNIGFRQISPDSSKGTLMIRVDGQWREAQVVVPGVPGIRPLK
jgi:hypothetical protein